MPEKDSGGNSLSNSDESLYEQALREVEDENLRKGLWAKAFSESLGDENKTKALYISLRVAQLRGLNEATEVVGNTSPESAKPIVLNDDHVRQPPFGTPRSHCEETSEIAEGRESVEPVAPESAEPIALNDAYIHQTSTEDSTRYCEKASETDVNKNTVERSELPYKLGLGGFLLLAIGHGWYSPELNARYFPEYWAYYLPQAAFFWIIFNCIFYSSPQSIWRKLSFFVFYASLIVSSQIGHEMAVSRQKASFSSIKSSYEEFAANATDEKGLPKLYKHSNNIVTNEERSKFEGFVKNFLHKTGELRNDFVSELAVIGWDKILDPSRVYNDRGLKETKSMIASARKAMADSLANSRAFMDASVNDIDLLEVDEGKKEDYRASFLKGVVEAKNMFEEHSALDEQIVDEIESLLVFLDKTRKRWNVEDELFVFQKGADQEKFNEMIGNIQDYTQKQLDIRKTASESRKQIFSNAQ